MKKLGLIFAVFLYFSLFLVPSVSYAQTSSPTKEVNIEAEIRDVDNQIRTIQGIANSGLIPIFVGKLQQIKAEEVSKRTASMTNKEVVNSILVRFASYLTDESNKDKSAVGGVRNETINAALLLINGLIAKASTNLQVEQGKITQAEADAKVKRATELGLKNAAPLVAAVDKYNKELGSECGFTNPIACVSVVFEWIIKKFILNIAGFLLWASANMLNYAIQISILDFKSWAPDTLYPIWIVVRQIVSLFVVFAGLWLGLMYIIGKDEKFEKYIPWVVIFALFVNFSYPITRTAIDISNVISLNIYASAVGNDALTGTGNNTAGALIMTRLGLQSLVTSATKGQGADAANIVTSISSVPGALMAVAFVLYAAYIFFMATALIIMRTIALVFITIASPILFIDSVIPQLGDQAVKLRKILFEQLTVGPVFMIMLALTMKFLDVFSKAAKAGGNANPTIVELFNIAMMLIMLHIMIKVTKSTAGSIGQMATDAMGKVGGFAGGMALGGVGMLGRQTIGRGATALRESSWMKNAQGGKIGRHLYNMTDSVAKSGFDARNSSFVQTNASKIGMGVGKGMGMGYEELQEARNKNLATHLGRIGTHSKDVYDDSGNRIHKKGDVDTSKEATDAVKRYTDNSGGAIFGKKDAKGTITSEKKKQDKALSEEALAKYKKLDEDYDEGEARTRKDEMLQKARDSGDKNVEQKLSNYDNKINEERTRREDQKNQVAETLTAAKKQAETAEKQAEATLALAKAQAESTKAMNDITARLAAKV